MMKNYILLSVFLAMAAFVVKGQDYDWKTIDVYKVPDTVTVVIDGVMQPEVYQSEWGSLDRWNTHQEQAGCPCDGTPVEGVSGRFKLAWDDDYLYLFCEITDNDFCPQDEIGLGIDIGSVREEHGYKADSKDENAHVFISGSFDNYTSAKDPITGIATLKRAEIFWDNEGNNWWYELRYPWIDVSTDASFLDVLWANNSFLVDVGVKNKYTDDTPSVGDSEYFAWSTNDNMFYAGSLKMGIATLMPSKVSNVKENRITNVEIFPNPAADYICLNSKEAIGNVALYDMTGRLVTSEVFTTSNDKLSVHGIQKGMYILVINGQSQKVTIK